MKSINSTKDFEDLLNQDTPVVIDFYADWCGPCQTLMPTLEKLSEQYNGMVEIQKINIDKNREIASQFGVKSIPSLFFIKNDEIIDRVNGLVPETLLRQKLNTLIAN